MPLVEEDFALADVVNSTGIAFRREAEAKGLMFQWKLLDGLDDVCPLFFYHSANIVFVVYCKW